MDFHLDMRYTNQTLGGLLNATFGLSLASGVDPLSDPCGHSVPRPSTKSRLVPTHMEQSRIYSCLAGGKVAKHLALPVCRWQLNPRSATDYPLAIKRGNGKSHISR